MTFQSVLVGVLLCLVVQLCVIRTSPAQIPQDHSYQITLRSYLATLTLQDFEIVLSPVVYKDSFFTSLDQLHATWILLEDHGRQGTLDITGLRVASSHFLLSEIERDGQVYMRAGRNSGFLDPINTAWWATWDYPGNPYFNKQSVKLRAFVAASVDMMMTDAELEENVVNRRSDYVGGYLLKYAYVYYVVKDLLSLEVQEAYEAGLIKFFDRLESYYPYGSGGADMEAFQLAAFWYTAEAIDSDDLRSRAKARSKFVLDEIMKGGGYHHEHGNDGIDLSYEGILHHFLSWSVLLYDDPDITKILDQSAKLKAYQNLPEPTGHFFSPSNFNTGTAKGESNDQWHSYQRDHAVAMASDEAKYLIWSGRILPEWYFQGVPLEARMKEDIERAFEKRNNDLEAEGIWAWQIPSDNSPGVWRSEHWLRGLAAAAIKYRPDFYNELVDLEQNDSPLMLPPFLRDDNFIEVFDETFVIAKFEKYGAIIHTGPTVSAWANGVPGLSGGSLSAFWTEDTGSVILGRSRGTQNADADQWEGERGWETWAVHAISGENSSGQPFSSARHRKPVVTKQVDGKSSAMVMVSGQIGQHDNQLSAPNNAITGTLDYERTFELEGSGLRITSSITSDGTDEVDELWEMIPFFLSDVAQNVPDATIEFYSNDTWENGTTDLHNDVTTIRTTRFGESIIIEFEEPRQVKLSSTTWTALGVSSRVQNVMVDLLENESVSIAMPDFASVSYTIRPEGIYKIGDTSGDGHITAFDAANILQHITGYEILELAGIKAADVSGDGTITAFDASLLLQYLVGLIECMPAETSCQ